MSSKADGEEEAARICVGAVAGAFGVRGEARIKPFTTEADAIGGYGPLETEDGARSFEIRITRLVKGGVAARLSGVGTREEAEALRGVRLYVPRERLPDLEEDEYYHADLIGMTVVDLVDTVLGEVLAVQNYGAGDYLEIEVPDARWPALLPFTREAVPHIDLSGRRVIADPPAGVFSSAESDEDDATDAVES